LPQYKTLQTTDRRRTDDRQTRHCSIGSTDSTVGQKPWVRLVWRRPHYSTLPFWQLCALKG